MEIEEYLERIGYKGSRQPTSETLRQLHRAHMLTVPFENLDIFLFRDIILDIPSFYDKIVRCRRGGFCYELNGLFGWLLEKLGFPVVKLSARVFDSGRPGPEFDHMVLLVNLQEPYIADVGFGDSFIEPLRLDNQEKVMQQGKYYRLTKSGSERVLHRREIKSDWAPQYTFSLIPRQLSEFRTMCQYHQTSPDSFFTSKAICSIAAIDGRITLSDKCLILTSGIVHEEFKVKRKKDYRALLKKHFGINIEEEITINKP